MNTITSAQATLDELGLDYDTDINHGYGANWTALTVPTPAGQALRIYSNDTETELKIAEWKNGGVTGRAITLTNPDARTIELTIKMLHELHA